MSSLVCARVATQVTTHECGRCGLCVNLCVVYRPPLHGGRRTLCTVFHHMPGVEEHYAQCSTTCRAHVMTPQNTSCTKQGCCLGQIAVYRCIYPLAIPPQWF